MSSYVPIVEHNGFIYIKNKVIDGENTNANLWFIAKNIEKDNIEVLSEAWMFTEQLGCSYNNDITKKIKECSSKLFVKHSD